MHTAVTTGMHSLILIILGLALVNSIVIIIAEIQVRKDMKKFLNEINDSGAFKVD